MTSEGRPYARFRRALDVRSVMQAETAAREMGRLGLTDALGFSGESFSAGIVDLAKRHRTYSTCRRLSPGMGQPPAPIEIAFLCSFTKRR